MFFFEWIIFFEFISVAVYFKPLHLNTFVTSFDVFDVQVLIFIF